MSQTILTENLMKAKATLSSARASVSSVIIDMPWYSEQAARVEELLIEADDWLTNLINEVQDKERQSNED